MLHFKDQEARKGRHYGGLNEISNAASDSWKVSEISKKKKQRNFCG